MNQIKEEIISRLELLHLQITTNIKTNMMMKKANSKMNSIICAKKTHATIK
jgi:hypothetical protein